MVAVVTISGHTMSLSERIPQGGDDATGQIIMIEVRVKRIFSTKTT